VVSEDVKLLIGKRLRHRRRTLGLTLHDLGASCGISPQQVQKYECGAHNISATRLWTLARTLEVPVAYFFEHMPGGI
jgi:transcriptional regulator with XRE-family HTH domain